MGGNLVPLLPKNSCEEILINTGAGKFVSAFWEVLRLHAEAPELLSGWLGNGPLGHEQREDAGYVMTVASVSSLKETLILKKDFILKPVRGGAHGSSRIFGRVVRCARVFGVFYLTEYPDVAEAVASGLYSSGLDHFVKQGRNNRRIPFASNSRVRVRRAAIILFGRR